MDMNDLIAKSIDAILASYNNFKEQDVTAQQRLLKAKLFYTSWCDIKEQHQRYCDIAALYALQAGYTEPDVRQYATNCLFIDTSKYRFYDKHLPIDFAVTDFNSTMLAIAKYVCYFASTSVD